MRIIYSHKRRTLSQSDLQLLSDEKCLLSNSIDREPDRSRHSASIQLSHAYTMPLQANRTLCLSSERGRREPSIHRRWHAEDDGRSFHADLSATQKPLARRVKYSSTKRKRPSLSLTSQLTSS